MLLTQVQVCRSDLYEILNLWQKGSDAPLHGWCGGAKRSESLKELKLFIISICLGEYADSSADGLLAAEAAAVMAIAKSIWRLIL